jgi:hypothetical protein
VDGKMAKDRPKSVAQSARFLGRGKISRRAGQSPRHEKWPSNGLRHSFITYRIAQVKSAEQVALEAGNSPAIIFKHYRELATEAQAAEWFGILPVT